MAYEFDPAHVPVVAELLDRAATTAEDPMGAWQTLWGEAEFQALDPAIRAEIDFLFTYELQEDFESAGEVKLVESGLTMTATRPLSGTPTDAWVLWNEVLTGLRSAMIGAHVADALLSSRTVTTQVHASATIALYLKASEETHVSAHHIALSLTRANDIVRSRRMNDEQALRATMLSRASEHGANPATMGPTLTLLSALSTPPRTGGYEAGERESVQRLLLAFDSSILTFIDEVAKSLARVAEGPDELQAARRWHVDQYLASANASDNGMLKMHHAQTAAGLAQSFGLADLQDLAVRLMQSVDQESMGWQTSEVEIAMSKNHLRAHLRRYRGARNWQHALSIFLASSSPSGSHEANVKSAENAARGSIRSVISRTMFGAHGLPERSNGDFMSEEVDRTETIALGSAGILLALELEHIHERFGPPGAQEVGLWMQDRFAIDADLAARFAETLEQHWAGRYSDAVRVSIPLIESAARGLLLRLDEALYRTQRGESPGRFPAMDFYVEALAKQGLDDDWVRALRITLLSPGMNMRNLAAHGFRLVFSEGESALVLRLAGLFCSMPIGVDGGEIPRPLTSARRRLRRRLRLRWVWT